MFSYAGKKPVDISEMNDKAFNLGLLLRLCDDPNVVLDIESEDSVVDHVCFFLRTFKGNLVVCNPKNNKVVFEAEASKLIPKGTTLSDFMLVSAKTLLSEVIFSESARDKIALNSAPTPFGVIKRADGTKEAMFQLVVDSEVLTELSEPYKYMSVDRFKNNKHFFKVFKQFKYTKD